MERIEEFKGEYRWLSNFWPVELPWGYASVEHAYQAAKTPDHKLKEWIRNAKNAYDAKKRGNHPKVGATMPEDWDEQKADIMYVLLRQKFFHLDLRQKLLATYPAILIEGNTWGDTYWGICRGEGQNMLGELLMRVRGEYMFATICEVCKKRLACFDWAINAGSCPGLLVCDPCARCEPTSTISDEDHAFGFLREQAPISPVAWEKLFQDTDLKDRARIWLQSWIDSGLCMLDDNLRVVVVESDENC